MFNCLRYKDIGNIYEKDTIHPEQSTITRPDVTEMSPVHTRLEATEGLLGVKPENVRSNPRRSG